MAKLFTKRTIVDEVLADTEKYLVKNDAGTQVYAAAEISLSTSVVTPGTDIDAEYMQHLEDGIDGIDTIQSLQRSLTSTVTAAGTTTLTTASNRVQEFTGTTTQTIVMPVVTTLTLGDLFTVINSSTGILTVNSSGANLIKSIQPGATCQFVCVLITGTTAASWKTPSYDPAVAIANAVSKTTPVDADKFGFWDSVSGLLNQISWGNIKATLKTYFDPYYSPNPNVIINGDFDIWQRGTSFAAIADGAYSADRFRYICGGAVHTLTKDTDVPTLAQSAHNSLASLKLDVTTADASVAAADFCAIQYKIEGYDYASLKGQTVTLSFYVKATKTGIYCIGFRNSGGDRSYVAEYTVNVTNTWEKKTVTLTLNQTGGTENYTNGIGLQIYFIVESGSNYLTTANTWQTGSYWATSNQVNGSDSTDNNFWLSQVKLELGSVATPFVSRPYGDELRLCKRYCNAILSTADDIVATGITYNTSIATVNIVLSPEMRVKPTLLVATATDWQLSDTVTSVDVTELILSPLAGNTTMATLQATVASGLTQYRTYFFRSDSTGGRLLILSAEL